jgi:hypothetical protein
MHEKIWTHRITWIDVCQTVNFDMLIVFKAS